MSVFVVCNGCGDDYPSDMVYEGLNDKGYCAWCLGFDPMMELPELTPEEVYERFLAQMSQGSDAAEHHAHPTAARRSAHG